MSAIAPKLDAYTRVDVETASQGKLIVMLFNGAIKRAEEAKRQMEKGKTESIHKNLIRAQEIIAELRGALNMNAGEIAQNLDRLYEYFLHLLVSANIHKDTRPVDECITLMAAMRDTWQEVFEKLARETAQHTSTTPNTHGASMLNLQG